MTPEEFVNGLYIEKQSFLNEYFSENSKTEVGKLIKELELNEQQLTTLKKVMDSSFTDIFYSILLGLDGCDSIGGVQEMYNLKDENGNQLSGEIEGFAFKYFQESKT